ncbi:MAG TPA: diacylglycerol kinase family protein [Candidatus Acidoferrum sp.]|jgi:YegS/Rv2252/BmrU family lipid kinase|nr:diacylglycerol kinase family protein [Candidatus Acidoferrum sp.]
MEKFFAIVNPAAGGGRSAKLAGPALARLREKGLKINVIASTGVGHAVQLAREAYDQGYRRFLAVGGDGTAHEILNGVFAGRAKVERTALGFLPLGTGNSFLRDFTKDGAEASLQALLEGRKRTVDLIRLTHSTGEVYSLNLLSIGFSADVAALTNRAFKRLGHLGYLLGVFVRVVQLHRRSFALRCDDDREWDERRSLFLTFNNSKYTGGSMLIAPHADPSDGLIEFVRWGPIGRLGLLRTLPRLYDGTHIEHPLASRRAVSRVEFRTPGPVDVMIDGEVATLACRSLDVLPAAVDVYI